MFYFIVYGLHFFGWLDNIFKNSIMHLSGIMNEEFLSHLSS